MPVFDVERRFGSIEIGNTPPATPSYPPYDTLALSLGPTVYVPGNSLDGPDFTPYDFLLSAFGPSIWVADGPITNTGPLDSYDEVVLDLGPTRYYPGDEVNP